MPKPLITTTDALRNAAFAVEQESKRLHGGGSSPSPISRELGELSKFLAEVAGDDGNGNQSCRIDITF